MHRFWHRSHCVRNQAAHYNALRHILLLLLRVGVGKTAIAEGLAYAIVHELSLEGSPLPAFLRSKRVLQLDVGLLMAGAKERGELENRVTRLIQECRDSGDVILM